MTTTQSNSAALAALKKAGQKYAKANAARKAAMEELLAAIRTADAEEGVSRAEIVSASGVAKQTVYNVLDVSK